MTERYYAVYDMELFGSGAEERVCQYHSSNPSTYTMKGLLKDASEMEEPESVVIVTVVE